MDLQSDSQGFLLGEARLKEIANGIDGVSDNTQAILDILTLQGDQLKTTLKQVVRDIVATLPKQGKYDTANNPLARQPVPTETIIERIERLKSSGDNNQTENTTDNSVIINDAQFNNAEISTIAPVNAVNASDIVSASPMAVTGTPNAVPIAVDVVSPVSASSNSINPQVPVNAVNASTESNNSNGASRNQPTQVPTPTPTPTQVQVPVQVQVPTQPTQVPVPTQVPTPVPTQVPVPVQVPTPVPTQVPVPVQVPTQPTPTPTESPAERMERIRRNRQASNPNNPLNNPASTRRRGANGRFEGAGANDSQNSDGSPNNANGRRRGANGRFESDGSTEQSGLQKLGKVIGDSVGQSLNVDAQGVDPLLDAMRELNQVITPAKRAFTLMGRGALWLFKRNRKPEISDEQDDANDQANRNDVTRNKLLQKLIDAVRAGRGGGGLLGGLLGGGRGMFGMLGKLGKGFLKRIPLLGTLLGGGMLASNWDGLDKEGKYEGVGGVAGAGIGAVIGGTLGSVVPVVGTAIGAMVGGVVGNWLGENAGKKLSEWTDYLEGEDIGGNIGRAWTTFTTGMGTWFKERYGAIADGIKTGFDTIFDLFKVIPNFIQNGFDQILAKFGNEDAKARIAARQQAEQAKQAQDAQDKPAPESKPQTLFERMTDSVKNGFDSVLAKFGSDDAAQRIKNRDNKPMVFPAGKQPTTISGVLSDSVDALKGGGGNAKNIKGFTSDKAKRISQVASNIGVDPNDLAAIISFETGGTFSPSVKNPTSSATGLIQFMKGSGGTKNKYYGMSREQFSGLPFDEQMGYVEKYYKDRGFDGKTKRNVADAYTAVTGYGYKQGTSAYDLNKVWDSNQDGYISKGEAVQNKSFKAHQRRYFDGTQSTNAQVPAPMPTTQAVAKPVNKPTTQVPFAMPMSMPAKSPFSLKIPTMPAVSNKLSGNPTASNINVTAPQSDIRQNVGDRTIAHIVTGGFGMQGMDV